jgi:hypothetical protein
MRYALENLFVSERIHLYQHWMDIDANELRQNIKNNFWIFARECLCKNGLNTLVIMNTWIEFSFAVCRGFKYNAR